MTTRGQLECISNPLGKVSEPVDHNFPQSSYVTLKYEKLENEIYLG